MPWFYCDDCGDTIKKPKVAAHCNGCSASSFTCIDCSRQFDKQSVQAHTQCVTEHEKYAQGATKPGGFAAKGFFGDGSTQPQPASNDVEGLEFLSRRAPWQCSICNVTCTSRETLMGHAQGAKHKRRAKAAIAARTGAGVPGGNEENNEQNTEQDEPTDHDAQDQPTPPKNRRETLKWKSLARAELKKSGGEMKMKKLIAALILASGGGNVDQFLEKLKSSKRFIVDGKIVRLRPKT